MTAKRRHERDRALIRKRRRDRARQRTRVMSPASLRGASDPNDKWLDFWDLGDMHGIRYSRSYIRILCERGDFPKPFKLSPRKLVWRNSQIVAWKAHAELAAAE